MEVPCQAGHIPIDKLPIGGYAVSAENGAVGTPTRHALEEELLHAPQIGCALAEALQETSFCVHLPNERAHDLQGGGRLPDICDEAFERLELLIRDDEGSLQDDVYLRVKPCHLQINPNEISWVLLSGQGVAHRSGVHTRAGG